MGKFQLLFMYINLYQQNNLIYSKDSLYQFKVVILRKHNVNHSISLLIRWRWFLITCHKHKKIFLTKPLSANKKINKQKQNKKFKKLFHQLHKLFKIFADLMIFVILMVIVHKIKVEVNVFVMMVSNHHFVLQRMIKKPKINSLMIQ